MNILHPPLWLYSTISIGILSGIWIAHAFTEGKSDTQHAFPKSEITRYDIGLPTDPWKPMAFADLSRQMTSDIIFAEDGTGRIVIYRYSEVENRYAKKQEVTLDVLEINSIIPIDFYGSGYNDLLVLHDNVSLSLLRNEGGLFRSEPELLSFRTSITPFVFDYWQNSSIDILYKDLETQQYHWMKAGDSFSQQIRSIAAGDFDKDERTELILETIPGKYEIWKFDGNNWVRNQVFDGPVNAGQLAVGDFDGNGYLDIVFPVIPVYGSSYLCIMFNSENSFHNDMECESEHSKVIPVDGIAEGVRPQVGDLRLEGSPDIGIEVSIDRHPFMQILLNQMSVSESSSSFTPRTPIEGTGAFVDLLDNGHLDVLTNKGSFISTLSSDSHYLKITALNGLCLDSCKSGKRHPKPPPIATVENGATVTIFFTDKKGQKRQSVAVQKATGGLTTPYVIFGLGDKVHYIDEINVFSGGSVNTWTWILPDTVLFASHKHQSRIYLMYNVSVFWVFFGSVLLLLALGWFALRFARQEDQEDKREADEMLPLF